MNNLRKIILALSVSVLISGLTIFFSFTETSKSIGLVLVITSSIIIYIIIKNRINKNIQINDINKNNLIIGLSLILFDLSFNAYKNDVLRNFDYGMILSGLIIIFLNVKKLNFLMKDKYFIDFITYFLFIAMGLYGFLLTGITFFLRVPTNQNPILIYMTYNSLHSAAFFANYIRPTTINDITINFDGFQVGVWYPCSGVESITIFISTIIAFFIATKETNWKKMLKYSLIGILFFYFMNILRILFLLIVGRNYGMETMLFVHYNLGWIMFVLGMMVFWMLAFDNMVKKSKK